MKSEHVLIFLCIPQPRPWSCWPSPPDRGAFRHFLYMGSMAQCINTSERASQYFVHGSLYDLLLIMSIICHLHSLLGIRTRYICKYHELFSKTLGVQQKKRTKTK